MPTYIILSTYTQKSIEHIKEGPTRLEMAKHIFKSMGAELKAFYMVMGQYDLITIIEAPDDETAAKASLAIGARGATRNETLRAFTEGEYRRIVSSLP